MALGRKPIEIVKEGKHQLLTKAKHWDRIYLGKVAKIQNGYAFSSKNFSKDEGVPLIRIRDIDKFTTVDKFNGKYNDEFIVKKGDILVGMDGDFNAARWKGENALLNQRVCRIIPNSENYNDKFLFLCLQPYLNAIHAETSAVTVKHISSKTIDEIPLPHPPIEEQNQIVYKIEELFSELEKGIEDLKTAQQQLKTYRQSVLKWAFEGKLCPLTPKGGIKEGELPEGWESKTFNDIIEISKEKHKPDKVESKFYIGLEHIGKNLGALTSKCGFEEIKTIKNNFRIGEILYGKLRPNLNKVYLAKENGVCSTDILVLKTKENCNAQFLTHLMLGSDFVNSMSENTNGVNLPRVSTKFILEYPINLPPLEEQHKIVQEIESRLSVADKMEESIAQSLQQAEALRQSILKRAFSGELL